MSEGILQPDKPEALESDNRDLFSKFDDVIALREGLLAQGREDPFNLVMEKVLSPTRAICNGRETILLGTYNYMGMTFDPDVVEAGKQALSDFGSGTTGSRVLNGTYQGRDAGVTARFIMMWFVSHGVCSQRQWSARVVTVVNEIVARTRAECVLWRSVKKHPPVCSRRMPNGSAV